MVLSRTDNARAGRASRRWPVRLSFEAPPIPVLRVRGRRSRACSLSNCALSLRRYRLLDDVAGTGRVDLDAGAHRGRERDRADVAALGGGGFGADQLLDHGRVILEQPLLLEGALAD